jgi:hypothetical protein
MDYPVEVVANIADDFADSKYFDRFYDIVTGADKKSKKPQPKKLPTISDTQRPKGDSQPRRSKRTVVDQSPSRYDPDEESSHSERVLREYEAERDDPLRKPSASLVAKSVGLRLANDKRRDSVGMSQAAPGYGRSEHGRSERATSQRGAPTRNDDYYDDEYESDYDDRTGRRTRATGRGYDAERDREFDREIIETERYRGVSLAVLTFTI